MTGMIFGLVLLIVAGCIFLYNRFIRLDNMVREAWSGVDVQLKRRYDLIPNLVTLVKGYMKHEKETLTTLTKLRGEAMTRTSPAEKEGVENRLVDTLKTVFVVAESYPKLLSDTQFISLQHTLTEIEDTLQVSRRYYNATVRNYNIAIHSFPGNLLAKMTHLVDKEYFEITASEAQNVEVKFHEK